MSGHRGALGVDMVAVQRDADALDALARRAVDAAGDDEVLGLLAALAADVDQGLADLLGDLAAPEAEAEVVPLPAPRRTASRAVAGALVVAGLLSVSGVAAAVTGDPLAAYRGLYTAVTGDHNAADDSAAELARLHRGLAKVRASIAHGDLATAQAAIDSARDQLSALPEHQRTSVEAQLDALEAALARARADRSEHDAVRRGAGAPTGQPSPDATEGPAGPTTGSTQGGRPTSHPARSGKPSTTPESTKTKDAKPQSSTPSPEPSADTTTDPTTDPTTGEDVDGSAGTSDAKAGRGSGSIGKG